MRIFTVLLTGFLLGLACSASAVEGAFLYLENRLSQPITSEPWVKPTLVTEPQTGLSANKLVFVENLPNPGAAAFPSVSGGVVPVVSAFAPLTSGSAFAVSVLPMPESESEVAALSEGAEQGTPHFPSYLTEEEILECSTSYHGQPLKLTKAAFLRLDIDGEEWRLPTSATIFWQDGMKLRRGFSGWGFPSRLRGRCFCWRFWGACSVFPENPSNAFKKLLI